MKNKIFTPILVTLLSITLSACGNTDTAQGSNTENISLGNYMNIETGLSVQEVTDEAIEEVIKDTGDSVGGYYEIVEGAAAEEGDKVNASYYVSSNTTDQYELSMVIGDEDYPEAFSEALTSLSAGDTTSATLPDDLGGDTYTFTVTSVEKPAEITDTFVDTLQIENVNTVDELREDVKRYLKKKYESEFNLKQTEAVAKIVVDSSTVNNIPNKLVESYLETINKKIDAMIKYQQEDAEEGTEITKADLLSEQMKKDEYVGTVDDYIKWNAEKNAKEYLVYKRIADENGIEVNEDELYSTIASDWSGETEEYPTLIDFMKVNSKESYERAILSTKVEEFLAENSKEGLIEIKETESDEAAAEASLEANSVQ